MTAAAFAPALALLDRMDAHLAEFHEAATRRRAMSTFPTNFTVTVPMRVWARAHGMPPRSAWLEEQTGRFAAYYEGGPEESDDWAAEWGAWMLHAWTRHNHVFNARGYCRCGTRHQTPQGTPTLGNHHTKNGA